MSERTVFLNPGDVLNIKIINDLYEPLNNKTWRQQLRPHCNRIKIKGANSYVVTNPYPDILVTTVMGKALGYLNLDKK